MQGTCTSPSIGSQVNPRLCSFNDNSFKKIPVEKKVSYQCQSLRPCQRDVSKTMLRENNIIPTCRTVSGDAKEVTQQLKTSMRKSGFLPPMQAANPALAMEQATNQPK
jgi:hypothetical protein